jgi:hypothetical protein
MWWRTNREERVAIATNVFERAGASSETAATLGENYIRTSGEVGKLLTSVSVGKIYERLGLDKIFSSVGAGTFKFQNPLTARLPPPPGTRNYPNLWGKRGQGGRVTTKTLRNEYERRTNGPVPIDPATGKLQQMSHEPPRWAGGPERQVIPRPEAEHKQIDKLYRAIYKYWHGVDPSTRR